ncbi:hypothetical protein QFZ34_002101 [Phyllobacterium ifriqiyense]|uniref:Uncharacterized protein n=1 Tax=Phyllobacterium ifriqiyense TaxID=314238 RepID=A0ABU0S831_9HYPH|nr:hypothetical protein [Phyllobacterium ifriqiyense]MDQ0996919.1 hypothetical protein [Phyllobacterium ifriqiyense]
MDNRIYLDEIDFVRTACENRARRAFWAAYILLATAGFSFIILFLGRVS